MTATDDEIQAIRDYLEDRWFSPEVGDFVDWLNTDLLPDHDALIAARTLREAADWFDQHPSIHIDVSGELRARADALTEGEKP